MQSRPARPIRTLNLGNLVLLVKCLSDFTHFVIPDADCSLKVYQCTRTHSSHSPPRPNTACCSERPWHEAGEAKEAALRAQARVKAAAVAARMSGGGGGGGRSLHSFTFQLNLSRV